MELVGDLQIIKDEEDEFYESMVFRAISYKDGGDSGVVDVRLEVEHKGRTIMFRFAPATLMAALAKSLSNPKE